MLSPRRVAAGLAALALLALTLLTGTPAALAGPAGAAAPDRCESSASTLSDEAKRARAVFTGTVEKSDVLASVDSGRASANDVQFQQMIVVDRVYKPGGSSLVTSERVDVITDRVQGECSLGRLVVGERYVVFASISDGDLVATGDSGTALAQSSLVSDVEQILGSGRLPVAPPPPEAQLTTVDTAVPTTFARAALPGAVLVLVSLLGLVVVRRLAR